MVFYKRMIDPGFWGSTTYVQAENEAEAVFWTGLICSADDQGRIKDVPQVLWATIFAARIAVTKVTLEDVERWLDKLVAMGNILRYKVGEEGFIQMLKWGTYQLLTRPRPSNMPPPPGWVDTVPWKGSEKPEGEGAVVPERPKSKPKPLPTGMPSIPGSANTPKDDPAPLAEALGSIPPQPIDCGDYEVPLPRNPEEQKIHNEIARHMMALGVTPAQAIPQLAVEYVMKTDPNLRRMLLEQGLRVLGTVGGTTKKPLYAHVAKAYCEHLAGAEPVKQPKLDHGQLPAAKDDAPTLDDFVDA